jgi:hypothetical protein
MPLSEETSKQAASAAAQAIRLHKDDDVVIARN